MRKVLFRFALFVVAVLSAGFSFAGENDVLYWMVDNSSTVEWWNGEGEKVSGSVSSFFDSYGAAEGSAFAARIRVTGGDITQDTFLDLYIPGYGLDEGGGKYGVEFSQVGQYWGAGVPTGNQSPSGDYSAGTPEYCFTVELGNIDSSDNWTTVAWSAATAYSDLGNYIHQSFGLTPTTMAVWSPTSFSTPVPEPSSGLLTVIGFAFLALRRKRKGV